eukprot:gene13664-4566_t
MQSREDEYERKENVEWVWPYSQCTGSEGTRKIVIRRIVEKEKVDEEFEGGDECDEEILEREWMQNVMKKKEVAKK